MKLTTSSLFGKILGLDPALRQPNLNEVFSLRHRDAQSVILLSKNGLLLTIAEQAWGRGPNRILVERIPAEPFSLPLDGWTLASDSITIPGEAEPISLDGFRLQPSENLAAVQDFPGHMRNALNRLRRQFLPDLESRLADLTSALQTPLTESVEIPLLSVLGRGDGLHPAGDAALCGMMLTGRAMTFGKRLRSDWLPRLLTEIRRFFHRTTKVSAAFIRFAAEGRTNDRQEQLFAAMARDYEGVVETALINLANSPEGPAWAFLSGVRAALEMVFTGLDLNRNLMVSGPFPIIRPEKK